MRHTTQSTQPLRRFRVPGFQSLSRGWHCHVAVPLGRQLGRVSRFYYQHVTLPVYFWRACGCPEQFTPRIPWWQPWVYRLLVLLRRRPVPPPLRLREVR